MREKKGSEKFLSGGDYVDSFIVKENLLKAVENGKVSIGCFNGNDEAFFWNA